MVDTPRVRAWIFGGNSGDQEWMDKGEKRTELLIEWPLSHISTVLASKYLRFHFSTKGFNFHKITKHLLFLHFSFLFNWTRHPSQPFQRVIFHTPAWSSQTFWVFLLASLKSETEFVAWYLPCLFCSSSSFSLICSKIRKLRSFLTTSNLDKS